MATVRFTTPDLEAVGPIPDINAIAELVNGTGTAQQLRAKVASPGKLNVVAKPDGRKWFEFKGATNFCLPVASPASRMVVNPNTPQGVDTMYNIVGFRLLVESMDQLGTLLVSNHFMVLYGANNATSEVALTDINFSQYITEPGEYYIEIRTYMVTYPITGTVNPYMNAAVSIDGVSVQAQSLGNMAGTVKANYMYWPIIRQVTPTAGVLIRDVYSAMALVGEENKLFKSLQLKAVPYRASAVSGYDNLPAAVTGELLNGFKETNSRSVQVNSTPTKLVGNGGYVDLVADIDGDRLVATPMLAMQYSRLDGVNTKVVVSSKLDDSALITSSSTTAGVKSGLLNHLTDAVVRPADTYKAIRVTYTPLS